MSNTPAPHVPKAFPHPQFSEPYPNGSTHHECEEGMDLRDWFAGMALAGMVQREPDGAPVVATAFARDAYAIADAMIAARVRK